MGLAARDNMGRTGYQCAQVFGKSNVVSLIKSKMPSLAFCNRGATFVAWRAPIEGPRPKRGSLAF